MKIMDMLARARRSLWRVVRCPIPWRESRLISLDGQMLYSVRERDGEERQVLHRWRGWVPVSKARFSLLPCFEDYHREKFNTAVPYTPNVAAHGGDGRSLP